MNRAMMIPPPPPPKRSGYARNVIHSEDIELLCHEFRKQLTRRIDRKGKGLLMSRHEILGVVAEEYVELCEAVHSGKLSDVRSECWDVAIAAVVGVCSVDGGVEW